MSGSARVLTPITALGLALVALLVYGMTLVPTVPGGDSGELITVAHNLGVAHPPGYPLFTMLGKLFTALPGGSIAWRVNLLSAACNAGAAVFLLLAVARWARSLGAGLLAGGLFAFSPLVWRYAVAAEVFALNNLFAAALLYLLVRTLQTGSRRTAYVSAFVVGLGLANHHTLVFYGAPFALLVLLVGRRDLLHARPLLTILGLFTLGLMPYAYMPIASAAAPWHTWGDQTTLGGFFDHLLRREYGTFKLGAETFGEGGDLFTRLGLYYRHLPGEVLWIGIPLAVLGLVAAARGDRVSRLLLVGTGTGYVFYVVVFHHLANLPVDQPLFVGIQARFWQMGNVLIAAWAGLGLGWLAGRVGRAGRLAAGGAAVALVITQIAMHFAARDEHDNTTFHDYARAILDQVPENGLLLCSGSDVVVHSTRYLQGCEGYRTDIVLLDIHMAVYPWFERLVKANYPDLAWPGTAYHADQNLYPERFDIATLIEANWGRRPICMIGAWKEGDDSARQPDFAYSSWPYGMVERFFSRDSPPEFAAWNAANLESLQALDPAPLASFGDDTWEREVRRDYLHARHQRAVAFIKHAIAHGDDPPSLRTAVELIDGVLRAGEEPRDIWFKNLGIAYGRLIPAEPGVAPRGMVEAWSTYLERVPGDPDAAQMRAAMQPHLGEVRRR